MIIPGRIGFLLFNVLIFLLSGRSISYSRCPPLLHFDADNTGYDVHWYKLDLQVSDTSIYLEGIVTIGYAPTTTLNQIKGLELAATFHIDSVTINDACVDYTRVADSLYILLSQPQESGSLHEVTVYYRGYGYLPSTKPTGIFNRLASINGKRYTYTLSEPFSAKHWFPCKQVLTDKADSVTVHLSTDATLKAGSNGLMTNIVALPDNRLRYEWKSNYPIAYYLVSFTVGEYQDYSFYSVNTPGGDSVLIQNYIYDHPAWFANNKSNIDKTADLMALFNTLLGPYPFAAEKYGHCIVPMGGGMEHQTMSTMGSFNFQLVAHELAHQWFGNYVTCGTWQDIWVNEGFASYAEYLALEFLFSKSEAEHWMRDAHQTVMADAGGSVFVPAESRDNDDRIFDYRLSYKKGAAIIHLIRHELHDDTLFFTFLKEALNRYSNKVATGHDLKNLLNELTGNDFTSFFDQWYYGEGYPEFTISWLARTDSLIVHSLQTGSSPNTSLFELTLDLLVSFYNRPDTLVKIRHNSNFQTFDLHLPGLVKTVRFDPNNRLPANFDVERPLLLNKTDVKYLVTPNPARESINVLASIPNHDFALIIVDYAGRIARQVQMSDTFTELSLEGLEKGPYILLIKENGRIIPHKFVKS